MQDNYPSIIGKDLGLVTGCHYNMAIMGIFIYKPIDNSTLEESNSIYYLARCIEAKTPTLTLSNKPVRQIFVNNKQVYKNLRVFNPGLEDYDDFSQSYWGRGDVKIEFNKFEGLEKFIQNILDNNMGFVRLK